MQTAYDIARQVDDAYPAGTDVSLRPYGERDDYTDLVWLAGQTAMKQLGRPADAIGDVRPLYRAARDRPRLKSKGFYWAGRAAEARRATARTRRPISAAPRAIATNSTASSRPSGSACRWSPPTDAIARPVDPGVRAAFYQREMVRAAQFLGTIGAHEDQTAVRPPDRQRRQQRSRPRARRRTGADARPARSRRDGRAQRAAERRSATIRRPASRRSRCPASCDRQLDDRPRASCARKASSTAPRSATPARAG